MRLPMNRPPTHPGEVLQEEFLAPRGISQREFASKSGVSARRLGDVIRGKRRMTADTAVLISQALETDPSWWMGFQVALDLWHCAPSLLKASPARRTLHLYRCLPAFAITPEGFPHSSPRISRTCAPFCERLRFVHEISRPRQGRNGIYSTYTGTS
jgi:addiction module HigA family antidote